MLGIAAAPSSSTGRETAFGRSTPVQMTNAAATSPQTAGTPTSPRSAARPPWCPLEARNVPTVYMSSALVTK
jgi:hypothetical protein